MSKSLSNRQALVVELQEIAARYQSKPSTLLAEFEHFLKVNGLYDKEIVIRHLPTPDWLTYDSKWKLRGFNSKQEHDDFENRPDFPGWDAL